MTFHSLRTPLAGLAIAATAVAFQTAPSAAQVMYGGYNLGPDYGSMIQEQLQRGQAMQYQMQQKQQQIVTQVMQDPRFQAKYRQYRAQGGQMSPQQYAYNYAATAGYTPDGINRFRKIEGDNQRREGQALRGLRQAEGARGQAQMDYSYGYQRNNNEFGNLLRGNSTYVAPNGQNYVLPHTQPGQVQRDYNGNAFVMDNRGQYYMYTPYGWQPMR